MKKYAFLSEKIDLYNLLSFAKRVYGPYDKGGTDGRKIVIVVEDDGSRRTVSYPKFILEEHLNRRLDPERETVDHRDFDINNNDISNLRIVPRDQHSADDTRRVKLIKLKCLVCKTPFERSPRILRDKSKKGNTSSFCSRVCAGKYSRAVQLGKRKKLSPTKPIKSEYYRRKNIQAFIEYANIKYSS